MTDKTKEQWKGLAKKVTKSVGLILIGVLIGRSLPYNTSKLEDYIFNQGFTKGRNEGYWECRKNIAEDMYRLGVNPMIQIQDFGLPPTEMPYFTENMFRNKKIEDDSKLKEAIK